MIGTGASGIQFIPSLAEEAQRLFVYQRTANWFLPRRNRAYPPWLRAAIRYVPGLQACRRRYIYHYLRIGPDHDRVGDRDDLIDG